MKAKAIEAIINQQCAIINAQSDKVRSLEADNARLNIELAALQASKASLDSDVAAIKTRIDKLEKPTPEGTE